MFNLRRQLSLFKSSYWQNQQTTGTGLAIENISPKTNFEKRRPKMPETQISSRRLASLPYPSFLPNTSLLSNIRSMKSFADLAALHKCFCNYLTPRHYSIACRKLVSIRKPLWKKPELHTAQAKTDQLIPFFTDLYALDVRNNMAEIGSEELRNFAYFICKTGEWHKDSLQIHLRPAREEFDSNILWRLGFADSFDEYTLQELIELNSSLVIRNRLSKYNFKYLRTAIIRKLEAEGDNFSYSLYNYLLNIHMLFAGEVMRPTERAEDWEDFKHQVITNALRVLPQLLQLKQLIINFTFYLLTREQHTIIRFLNHNSMFNDFSEMQLRLRKQLASSLQETSKQEYTLMQMINFIKATKIIIQLCLQRRFGDPALPDPDGHFMVILDNLTRFLRRINPSQKLFRRQSQQFCSVVSKLNAQQLLEAEDALRTYRQRVSK